MRNPASRPFPAFLTGFLWSAAAAFTLAPPAIAGTLPADEMIFADDSLRIYMTVDRQGRPTMVLTNLDASGTRLPGMGDEGACAPAPATAAEPAPGPAAPPPPAAAGAGEVRVVVRSGGEPIDGAAGQVEVKTEGGGSGTTVVVNINNPPPPPAQTPPSAPIVPVLYPFAGVGGLPGPYRYPDRHYFLGYGTDNRTPSLMGGLALNAGNRFGLKTGTECGTGYDCMYAPSAKPAPAPGSR